MSTSEENAERLKVIAERAAERGQLTKQFESGNMDKDCYNLKVMICDIWPGSVYEKMGMDDTAKKALKALTIIKNLSVLGKIPENWEECVVNGFGEVVKKQ